MPAEWAASGARLGVSEMGVTFSSDLCTQFSDDLLGPPKDTYRCQVLAPGKFVGANGEQLVRATNGAWSETASGRGGEYFLRFFVDIPEGAARNDVELPAGRLFFTTGYWDAQELELAQTAVEQLQSELSELEAIPIFEDGGNVLQKALEIRRAVTRDERKTMLRAQLRAVTGSLPGPSGTVDIPGRKDIQVGKSGGLCVKRKQNLGQDAYFILGKFTMVPMAAEGE
jgi:hypothetical protein